MQHIHDVCSGLTVFRGGLGGKAGVHVGRREGRGGGDGGITVHLGLGGRGREVGAEREGRRGGRGGGEGRGRPALRDHSIICSSEKIQGAHTIHCTHTHGNTCV